MHPKVNSQISQISATTKNLKEIVPMLTPLDNTAGKGTILTVEQRVRTQ